MKTTLFATILLSLSLSVVGLGQTVTSITTSDKATVKSGDVATITTTVKNTATVVPIVLTPSAVYTDSLGVEQTIISAPLTFNVVHPAVASKVIAPIPATVNYIANSAKVDGVSVTPAVTSTLLTIPFTKTMNDQDTCLITFQFQVK